MKDVTLQDAEIDCSRSDKEARQLVESNVIVKDSRFEIPVPLKEGVEALPNNLAVAQSRLEILRKEAMKDDDLDVFLTQSSVSYRIQITLSLLTMVLKNRRHVGCGMRVQTS